MKGKSVYKAGKLVKISLDYSDDKIDLISITGDFFIYPEQAIRKLEKDLIGSQLDAKVLESNIKNSIQNSEVFGFTPEQLAEAILQAVVVKN